MRELNVDPICTDGPRAKGRVERAHETLQDRLVEEPRLPVRSCGAEPAVPARPTRKDAPPHGRTAHRRRHEVENLWARLKERRAVATRHEKAAASHLGDLHLAAALGRLPVS